MAGDQPKKKDAKVKSAAKQIGEANAKASSNEIDDIFGAGESKTKKASTKANEAAEPPAVIKPTPRSKKKTKRKGNEAIVPESSVKAATAAVEVVHYTDLSTMPGTHPKAEDGNKKRKVESKDEFLGNSAKKRFTEDGFPVYYLEDLIAQTGGDTEDCPFECKCCY